MKWFIPALVLGITATLLSVSCKNGEGSPSAGPTEATPSNGAYSGNAIDAFDPHEDEIREEVYGSAYEEGYREGRREGEQAGYDEGYTIGYDEGFFDGCVWLGETFIANGAQIWYQC